MAIVPPGFKEGASTWFVSASPAQPPLSVSSPTPDLHVLLLEDLLVLLQKQDEKLVLKCHSKTALGSSDNKQTFSPVLKLNSVLIRSVATGREKGQGEATGGWQRGQPVPRPRPAAVTAVPVDWVKAFTVFCPSSSLSVTPRR